MALVATAGSSSANSYATVSEGDTYHDNHLYASTWTSATDANKEKALIMATRILDEKMDWVGTKTTQDQALAWGREGVEYDSYPIVSTIVPDQIKNATIEFARHLLDKDWTKNKDDKGIGKISVGSINIEYDKMDTEAVVPDIVQEMLRIWGTLYTRSKFGTVAVVRS